MSRDSSHRSPRASLARLAFGALLTALAAPALAQAQAAQQPLPPGYIRQTPVQPGHAPKMHFEQTTGVAHVYSVRLSTGDEILSGLTELAEREHITEGYITGLGGLSTALLGWGDPANGAFKKIVADRKCELVSMVGDISMRDGKPYVHVHAVVAFDDGSTKAGHMLEANVAPIAEITVVATHTGSK